MEKWNRWQDWANVVLGVVLFITPFVFGATGNQTVAFTAYIGGVLLVLVGLFNLANPASQAGEWTEGVLGALVFLSPWLLGFAGLTMMAWSAWIVGVLAVILTASVLLTDRSPQRVAARR